MTPSLCPGISGPDFGDLVLVQAPTDATVGTRRRTGAAAGCEVWDRIAAEAEGSDLRHVARAGDVNSRWRKVSR